MKVTKQMQYRIILICSLILAGWSLALQAAAAAPPSTQAAPTGRMRLKFDERSPLSAPAEVTYRSRFHTGDPPVRRALSDQENASLSYDLGDYEFDVIVPPRSKRGVPHGLFIWVGQCDLQNVWLPILARHKLIAAVPEDPRIPRDKKVAHVSKTGHDVRFALALDAVHSLSKRYDIDPQRIYVAGFSAGGALAADLLRAYPEVFDGVCCFMGGEFYVCPEDAEGKSEPSSAEDGVAWQCPIEEAKRDKKIVLMRGDKDRARNTAAWGRADAESLRLEGFTRVTYIELPDWPHFPPTAPWFNKAITALERKPSLPPTTRPTTGTGGKPHPDQLAQARRFVAGAKIDMKMRTQFLPGGQNVHPKMAAAYTERARAPLKQVLADYAATPAAEEARRLLAQLDAENPRDAATTP
jgi:pimeloyl-ACP methyl ester carboxylesterase